MNTQNQYADVFTSSNDYARRFSGKEGVWLVKRQSEIISKFLRLLNPVTILDVAGGHGQIASYFSDKYKVTVLGSTAECDGQVKQLVIGNKCSFEAGDIEKLKYPDNSYDVVTCLRYISHTENWQTVIKELCRVAKKAVIIDFPPLISFNLLTPLLFRIKKQIEGNTRTYTIFTKQQIYSEFKKCGYAIQSYQGQFFYPMAVHRLLKAPAVSSALELPMKISGLTNAFGSPALACFVKESPVGA